MVVDSNWLKSQTKKGSLVCLILRMYSKGGGNEGGLEL